MRHHFLLASALALLTTGAAQAQDAKATVILVHGAFADASSWNGVVENLRAHGFKVIAAANPLRSVATDGAYVAALAKSVAGPVVLVGHSYGGSVISAAGGEAPNVKALVFVSAFAPDHGETALGLSGKFPGSTLGQALGPPVTLPGGGVDLYIQQEKFGRQFAADLPPAAGALMAAEQRPITQAALEEKSGAPAWKSVASWSIYGSADRNIPPAAMAFMAQRAKSKKTVVVPGASHVVMVSHPKQVAALIEEAAVAAAR
jgi:pimeloyl-ACP methyl ester carboxylesterase